MKCVWCEKEAVFTFVGRTFDDEFKMIVLCAKHQKELNAECRKQGIGREKGLVKKVFNL